MWRDVLRSSSLFTCSHYKTLIFQILSKTFWYPSGKPVSRRVSISQTYSRTSHCAFFPDFFFFFVCVCAPPTSQLSYLQTCSCQFISLGNTLIVLWFTDSELSYSVQSAGVTSLEDSPRGLGGSYREAEHRAAAMGSNSPALQRRRSCTCCLLIQFLRNCSLRTRRSSQCFGKSK